MFKWLNKQGVEELDKGFSVQCTGRFSSEYREGNRVIEIYADRDEKNGIFCDLISKDAFAKWSDGTPISPEKQKEILQNYTDAMNFQDMGVIVD